MDMSLSLRKDANSDFTVILLGCDVANVTYDDECWRISGVWVSEALKSAGRCVSSLRAVMDLAEQHKRCLLMVALGQLASVDDLNEAIRLKTNGT